MIAFAADPVYIAPVTGLIFSKRTPLADLTAVLALQLLLGYATEDRNICILHHWQAGRYPSSDISFGTP